MTDDIFGDILDAGTVESYVRATLQGDLLEVDPGGNPQSWLVAHLAHQERRSGLPPRTLPWPRSWPTISEFDIEKHEQMPAIVIVSPGGAGGTHDRGVYRPIWRFEIAVAVAGKTEVEGRMLAALYLAAIKGALIQHPTLGGNVEQCRWVIGSDDHAFGVTERGAQRAIYGTAFEVTVRDAVSARQGPGEPPADPYDPPDAPPSLLEAQITVTATRPEDTP